MEKILLIVSLFLLSCAGKSEKHSHDQDAHASDEAALQEPTLQLNNGAKWKSDEPTRKNVHELERIINDSKNTTVENRGRLSQELQTAVNTLVKECKMKGPDHDALHVWLEKVLHDLKLLRKANEAEYPDAVLALKKDIGAFHNYFD